jgi:hypothetical protein
MDKTSGSHPRLHARDGCRAVADARAGSLDREAHRARAKSVPRKAIARSPIAVVELFRIGDELACRLRSTSATLWLFSIRWRPKEHEDRSEEYLQWTIEGLNNIQTLYKRGLKEFDNSPTS